MLSLQNAGKRFGPRILFQDANWLITAQEKTALVGANGTGKSTLMKVLAGLETLDYGMMQMTRGMSIGYLPQEGLKLSGRSVFDECLSVFDELHVMEAEIERLAGQLAALDHASPEYTAAAERYSSLQGRFHALDGYALDAQVGSVLTGLGFGKEDWARRTEEFSGGWQMRIALAKLLLARPNLLLLDEPTNHLDLDAVLWLEEWLRRYQGTLLIISHDREFLDGVITHTMHLHDGKAKMYTGNYSAFERLRAEQLRQQQITHEREQAERAHLQSFVDRFKAKASKAKQAQSRMKRLEKLAGTEAVRADRSFHFQFAKPDRLPDSMLQLEEIVTGYPDEKGGPDNIILDNVRFSLEAGDRIGLLGPNGAGKSTLVKTLVGELDPFSGERKAHKDLKIGYFAQHTVESLREGASPLEHLMDKAPGVATQVMRDFLGTWNFAGDRAFESVDGFSGGERARLALALIAWDKPNLLLLDEPTNHLDLDMREALADALSDFDGALVLVSHDRHLLGLVCDSFWRVADGVVEGFDGDLDDYAKWLRSRGSANKKAAKAGAAAKPEAPVIKIESSEERKRNHAAQRENEKVSRQRVKKIESRTASIDAELATLETTLADPATYNGPTGEMMRLGQRQTELRKEKEALETEWLEIHEQLEA